MCHTHAMGAAGPSLAPPAGRHTLDGVHAINGHAVRRGGDAEIDAICIRSFGHGEPCSGREMTEKLQPQKAWFFMVGLHGARRACTESHVTTQ